MSTLNKNTAANIVWFEIPADNIERAKSFYGALFGWKINPFHGMNDYLHIDTGGSDDTPDGGLMARRHLIGLRRGRVCECLWASRCPSTPLPN